MARNTKVAKRAAGKRVASKKKSPKKGKSKKSLVQSIAVVSSIDLSPQLKNAFEAELPSGVTPQYAPSSYDPGTLGTTVDGFNDPTNWGLIVTFGGVAPATAANAHATKVPWLMLVGGTPGLPDTPPGPTGKFFGGVNLDTYGHNADRIKHFGDKGIPPSQICLLYNHNSGCSTAEAGAWTGGTSVMAWTGANDSSLYGDAFNHKIPNGIKVVVISADPYFQATMSDLIVAAKHWRTSGAGRHVCYPLQEYGDTDTGSTSHGPSLVDAYARMGKKAKAVLRNGSPSTFTRLPPGNPNDH
jgi:hypothetical protein